MDRLAQHLFFGASHIREKERELPLEETDLVISFREIHLEFAPKMWKTWRQWFTRNVPLRTSPESKTKRPERKCGGQCSRVHAKNWTEYCNRVRGRLFLLCKR